MCCFTKDLLLKCCELYSFAFVKLPKLEFCLSYYPSKLDSNARIYVKKVPFFRLSLLKYLPELGTLNQMAGIGVRGALKKKRKKLGLLAHLAKNKKKFNVYFAF